MNGQTVESNTKATQTTTKAHKGNAVQTQEKQRTHKGKKPKQTQKQHITATAANNDTRQHKKGNAQKPKQRQQQNTQNTNILKKKQQTKHKQKTRRRKQQTNKQTSANLQRQNRKVNTNSQLSHLCTTAQSRPCTTICPHVRIACLYHVPRQCTCFFFLFRSASTVLRALLPTFLTVFAGAIFSLSIEVVEDCLNGLPVGLALQPARVVSDPVVVLDTRKHSPT